ncbi:MAG: hypothetical protein HOP12_06905 [Candidatus Eisenbacteria bacterium]|uniref:Uncharacterized protein n=1 Tax=Eiseniibacteriota bacterium TaxID=2212470 RepID=A0A849SJN9_UNCEI|nr:hypothetical protein [Candidatus Eisenbacteria bacterium]
MRTHRIAVTVDKSGIRVEPDSLTMTPLDDVHWASMNEQKFTIVFDSEGPFGVKQLAHADAALKQRPRYKGLFKYTVISVEDPTVQLDPVIIVDEPPSSQL